MKRLAILVVPLALSVAGCAEAQGQAAMSSLPVAVREALLALCTPCDFADENAPWNPTDVLDGRPRRHLTRIEQMQSKWLIQYDHGGIATHTHTVIFELEPNIHVGRGSSCDPAGARSCEW